jgi:hypothetical protein
MSLRAKKWGIAVAFMLVACACVWLFGGLVEWLLGRQTDWRAALSLAPWLLVVGRMVAEWVLTDRGRA